MSKAAQGNIEGRVTAAYSDLISWAKGSKGMGRIAMQPNKGQEEFIRRQLLRFLRKRRWKGGTVLDEEGQNPRYDIVMKHQSTTVAAIEVKTPFTNHDGITHKTREYSSRSELRPGDLHKDLHSLRTALQDGTSVSYSLVIPIGSYPVDVEGGMVVFYRGAKRNEEAVKAKYPILWPTRQDYETNPKHGTLEVDRAMNDLGSDHGLEINRIKGWDKVEVPSPRLDVFTFIDCALFRVQLE